jgi:SAM-dependent methyltransferase
METVSMPYVGTELELFARAANWKAYLARQLEPFIVGDVLEVGAGMGANTALFLTPAVDRWTCLEPDGRLASRIDRGFDSRVDVRCGILSDLEENVTFDVIMYIDVLEHIEDDAGELAAAAARLRPGGHLIVLSPAHPWLFSPFDAAIGHWRRYTRRGLRGLGPTGCRPVRLRMLDAVGLLASVANKLLLRSAMPTAGQIALWDRGMVPVSRLVDPLLGHRVGKSVLAVWRREAA